MLRALLTSRVIQVVSDGLISTTKLLSAGVPQGSILAPFLFLIYIHDITSRKNIPRSILLSLFADDIALMPTRPGTAGMNALQSALDSMSEYARKWKITFSTKKTNVVFYRFGKLPSGKPHPRHTLTLSNSNIKTTTQYTYLGIVLDYRLSFVPHVCDVITKVRCTANKICRLVRRDHLPSIPVIRTLVQCVLVPQMTYGFPFVAIGNKSISTTQVTGNSTHSNFYIQLKNIMLRPLLFCMGLPHNAHHRSVFVENRLMNIESLLSLSAAWVAHRWLELDDTNPTAELFRNHIASPPTSPFHPFNRLRTAIEEVPALQFNTNNIQTFKDLPHKAIRKIVWTHQYRIWRNTLRPKTNTPHSLPPYYPAHVKRTQLPRYMHIDDPKTAARRARLRFGRARLRYDQHRLGFQDINNPTCQQCNMNVDETVDHVTDICPKYEIPRLECSQELQALQGLQCDPTYTPLLNKPLNKMITLIGDPRSSPTLNKIIEVTAKFINAIYDLRQDNF
jgi:hypothetical protein